MLWYGWTLTALIALTVLGWLVAMMLPERWTREEFR